VSVSNLSVALICSNDKREILLELFSARNIVVDDSSQLVVVENNCEIPRDKVSIVFEWNQIKLLFEVLEKLSLTSNKVSDETADFKGSIIGKVENENYEIIPFEEVCYFEARGNYVFCITGSSEYRVKEKLYELDKKLPVEYFIRISRSYIVNINNVKQIIPWFGRRLALKFNNCKKEVEVSKNYVKNFKKFLGL